MLESHVKLSTVIYEKIGEVIYQKLMETNKKFIKIKGQKKETKSK